MAKNSDDDGRLHNVFINNPVELKSFVNKYVEVETIKGRKYCGTVYTIDPVSESIVLINKANGKWSVDVVMGVHKCKISKCFDDVQSEPIPENIFTNFQEQPSEKDITKRQKRLKEWLHKNRVPVIEEGVNLKLGDNLVIIPPYGKNQCLCSNEIVLDKIQKLIDGMEQKITP